MSEPITKRDLTTDFDVPEGFARCPDCDSPLRIEVLEYETETGAPTEGGVYVWCSYGPNPWNGYVSELPDDNRGHHVHFATQVRIAEWASGNLSVYGEKAQVIE